MTRTVRLVCQPFVAAVLMAASSAQAQKPSSLETPPPVAAKQTAQDDGADHRSGTQAGRVITENFEPAPTSTKVPIATETRIEQKRRGNRVVEMVVTPAGSQRSYVIVNREGQRPLSTQELSSGLSTPQFFKFEF